MCVLANVTRTKHGARKLAHRGDPSGSARRGAPTHSVNGRTVGELPYPGPVIGHHRRGLAHLVTAVAGQASLARDRINTVLLTATSPTLGSVLPGGATASVVVAGAVTLAVVLGVVALLDRSAPPWALGLVLLLELGLVVLGAIAVIAWIRGDAPAEPVVFLCYLAACLVVPPLMVWWGRGEPGRWGSGVIAVGCLVLAALILRVEAVWTGPSAMLGS